MKEFSPVMRLLARVLFFCRARHALAISQVEWKAFAEDRLRNGCFILTQQRQFFTFVAQSVWHQHGNSIDYRKPAMASGTRENGILDHHRVARRAGELIRCLLRPNGLVLVCAVC